MSAGKLVRRPWVAALVVVVLSSVAALVGSVAAAIGSGVTSIGVSGGAGTVVVDGLLHAKRGALVTLAVKTSADTRCVEVKGVHAEVKTSTKDQADWTFTFTAPAGDGVQGMTVQASSNSSNNRCNGKSDPAKPASYVLDNTGPVVTGTVRPTANAAGWSNQDVTIGWTASDVSGIAAGPTPASDTQTTATAGVDKTASATDRLGNSAGGRVTVKLDEQLPSIDAVRTPAPNAAGWNRTDVQVAFTCSDDLSGIKTCTGGGTVTVADEGADQRVPGTAVDNADNVNSAGVTGINIDKTAPALTGAPREEPNTAGWYRGDVAIRWTATDGLSGIAGAPADGSIGGEGRNLTASASVEDRAGNRTPATSAPVRIDRTAPVTSAVAPDGWSRGDVSVTLQPADALSGVASTSFQVDGGPVQTGTAVVIADDGKHMLTFWSTDEAGNVERARSIGVSIDGTAPGIRHELDREANANNWFREDVGVDFICQDATAGIASCGPDAVVVEERSGRQVAGRAVDHAGNTADDHVTVSLDKTDPTITASADRVPDASGWYRDDVMVAFACADALSGIDRCPAAEQLGEGGAQSASGSASDAAGNTASAGVSGIDVDKTAPTLTGAATPRPNAAGWNAGDVTVAWDCSDALSGVDGDCPASQVLRGEGSDVSASASVRDRAGNVAEATVAGIRIDRTAPSTTARVDAPLPSGWYADRVEVVLDAADTLSGVASTFYRVDDHPAEVYTGPFEVTEKGRHTVTFWSEDEAGNVEDPTAPGHAVQLKIDGIPPTITGSASPAANGFGWNNTDVVVSFLCSDEESGLDPASGIEGCDPGTTFANEGTGLSYTGSARDLAGNGASATVEDINIDKTRPTLAGAATPPANAAGWHRDDVTVTWTGEDALSGIDADRRPADAVVTGEGDALAAGPVTTFDRAGNESLPASVGPIRIDRTAPGVTGAPATRPNDAGWYRGAVRVTFTCADTLSGCAEGIDDEVLEEDGADQSVTSEPAADLAGNTAPGATVGGVDIDSKAPSSSAEQRCDGSNGFCRGETATVVLTAADQAGLSGVQEIRYAIDGGPEQVAEGASVDVSVPLAARSGKATLTYRAVDRAGNAEPANVVSLTFDNLSPTVTHTVTPPANAAGWNDRPLTVRFDASDDDGGSGVDPATVTPDTVVSEETEAAGRRVVGQAADLAGNVGSDAVTVKLDRTAPTITATVTGTQGADGWYTGPVTVRFTCADALSTVATCSKEAVVTTNGSGQSVRGEAMDRAGNTATTEVTGLNIDSTKPVIELRGIAAGERYVLGAVPTASCGASDNISTSVACSVTVTGGTANGVGLHTYTATATDAAGNTATESGTYSVIYKWSGLQQPINDTTRNPDSATSIFKAGSTVPAKFTLRRADGTVVTAGAPPVWLTPAKGTAITADIDESVHTATPTAGGVFKLDAASGQYHYNWGTPRVGGNHHRLGVALDDGQTYYVNVGLR